MTKGLWFTAAAVLIAIAASALPASARGVHTSPATTSTSASQTPNPSASAASKTDRPKDTGVMPLDRVSRGIVVIERAGKSLALGTVLAGDGRVLTSLSALGDQSAIDARYADGSVVRLDLSHSDPRWDLALLVPHIGRWTDGLSAATQDASSSVHVQSFARSRRRVVGTAISLKGRTELQGRDGSALRDAIEIGTRVPGGDVGAPIINEKGQVLAVITQACARTPSGSGPCANVVIGAPMDALKQFLRTAPTNTLPPSAWLGIQGVQELSTIARGVRVIVIHPGSPADEAGLLGGSDPNSGDVIVSVDGIPVSTPEKLSDAVREKTIGDKIELIVLRGGRFRTVQVSLRAAPGGRARPDGTAKRP